MKPGYKILIGSIVFALSVLLLNTGCGPNTADDRDPADQQDTSAIIQINRRVTEEPGNAEPLIERARFHMSNENYVDAIFDIAAAMKIDSVNEGYHHLLVDAYLGSYKSEYAIRTMDRALRLFPESVPTLLKAAELYLILRQYEPAQQQLRRVLELSPQNTEALYLLGQLSYEQGNIKMATQSFQTVVELEADNKEAWTMLGNLLDMQDDPLALQCFDNAIAIDSSYSPGLHSKAFYLQNHDSVDAAIEIYKRIHRIDPDYPDAYLNAGILYLEKGELDRARSEFQELRDRSPTNPLAPYYLGVVAEESGNVADALGFYNQASALSPREVRFAEAVQRMKIALGQNQ